jgi:phenylacetate-CoA ligase
MRWLDTEESWSWMLDNWKEVLHASHVTANDVIFFAFSFGPFLGFWTAYGASERLGCLCISGGGMSSEGRLDTILANRVTTICCTPTYALRLGQIAEEKGINLSRSAIKTIIVAGEPGGSVPSTRERISQLWNGARVFDHHGMTEVGPVTVPNFEHPYILHVLEEAYLAEVLDPDSLEHVAPGQTGELVLTTLGRLGSPLLRYRTGDLVRLSSRTPEALGTARMALEGGILTRNDDMLIVRGINIFPASVEEVMRRFPEVAEYQVEVTVTRAMTELKINVEPDTKVTDKETFRKTLEKSLRTALQIRIPVQLVPQNALPRFEMKAKRWVRLK